MKTYGFSEFCDCPYENIGFDTPWVEGGALVYFITQEQNNKKTANVIWLICVTMCLYMAMYLTQNPPQTYEKIGFGEGRYPYENIWFSASVVIIPMKT